MKKEVNPIAIISAYNEIVLCPVSEIKEYVAFKLGYESFDFTLFKDIKCNKKVFEQDYVNALKFVNRDENRLSKIVFNNKILNAESNDKTVVGE